MVQWTAEFLGSASGPILAVALVLFALQWTMWILARGRYYHSQSIETRLFPRIATKVIGNFRHLFALIIVLTYAAVVLTGFVLAANIGEFTDVLESGASTTLVGLVGGDRGLLFR